MIREHEKGLNCANKILLIIFKFLCIIYIYIYIYIYISNKIFLVFLFNHIILEGQIFINAVLCEIFIKKL